MENMGNLVNQVNQVLPANINTNINTNLKIPVTNNLLDPLPPLKQGGMFSFLNKFKENKLYLFIVIGVIILSAGLYYLFLKNKEKKQAKLNNKNMMNVINANEPVKLLFNPVDKQYYSIDSSGNPVKTTLDSYQNSIKNNPTPPPYVPPQISLPQISPPQMAQQQMAQQQMAQQQMMQQQMAQQQMAQQQMMQQKMAQQQMMQQKMAQQKMAEQQIMQQKMAQQKMAEQQKIVEQQTVQQKNTKQTEKNKLKHQIDSSSEESSSNVEYDMDNVDDDPNISQFNLNSEEVNDINSKLSE
jgi:type IV secretory pathway VirB10-like protein